MTSSSLFFSIFVASGLLAGMAQSQGTCFLSEDCSGTGTAATAVDNLQEYCCTYVSPGNTRGLSYRSSGSSGCSICPKIFGFFDNEITLAESSNPHSLRLGFLSGPIPLSFVIASINTRPITATATLDYVVEQRIIGLQGPSTTVFVRHQIDGVAQENNEQYVVELANNMGLNDYSFRGTTVTIVDRDQVRFFFTEADHSGNEGDNLILNAPLAKDNIRLANSVTFLISPMTIMEARRRGVPVPEAAQQMNDPDSPYEAVEADFNTTSFQVVFPADENRDPISSIPVELNIIDDEINERFQQVFLIGAEVLSAVNPSTIDNTERNVTMGIVLDDDDLIIGFSQPIYNFDEPDDFITTNIYLVKEGNKSTEQTFEVQISLIPSVGIAPATHFEDFVLDFNFSKIISFRYNQNAIPLVLVLNPDDKSEQNEEILLESSPVSFPFYSNVPLTSNVSRATRVIIMDDDPIIIGFEEPVYRVKESESVTICVRVTFPPLSEEVTPPNLAVLTTSFEDITASSDDYSTMPNIFISIANSPINDSESRRSCITVDAQEDSEVEGMEELYVHLGYASFFQDVNRVIIQPNRTTLEIIDQSTDRGLQVNDTVIGDPLYSVPIRVPEEQLQALGVSQLSLCYELHGKSDEWFNLVTDNCVSVNTHYTSLTRHLNIMDSVAVRAVDEDNTCLNIRVDLNGCTATVGNTSLNVSGTYSASSIMVKRYSNRVRISVPNCQDLTLVMWVICEQRSLYDRDAPDSKLTAEMIKFVILRGLNFDRQQAHGILGQFWNVPVSVTPYEGDLWDGSPGSDRYVVNITTRGTNRAYTGTIHRLNWDHSVGPCLYVGNKQSGPVFEVQSPNDPVIQNFYGDYLVKDPFQEVDYKFGMFEESRCT